MAAQRQLDADDPIMVAWNAHKATESAKSNIDWTVRSVEGAMWGAFLAGRANAAEVTTALRDLLDYIDNPNKADDVLRKMSKHNDFARVVLQARAALSKATGEA
jgi:hypothetical protein